MKLCYWLLVCCGCHSEALSILANLRPKVSNRLTTNTASLKTGLLLKCILFNKLFATWLHCPDYNNSNQIQNSLQIKACIPTEDLFVHVNFGMHPNEKLLVSLRHWQFTFNCLCVREYPSQLNFQESLNIVPVFKFVLKHFKSNSWLTVLPLLKNPHHHRIKLSYQHCRCLWPPDPAQFHNCIAVNLRQSLPNLFFLYYFFLWLDCLHWRLGILLDVQAEAYSSRDFWRFTLFDPISLFNWPVICYVNWLGICSLTWPGLSSLTFCKTNFLLVWLFGWPLWGLVSESALLQTHAESNFLPVISTVYRLLGCFAFFCLLGVIWYCLLTHRFRYWDLTVPPILCLVTAKTLIFSWASLLFRSFNSHIGLRDNDLWLKTIRICFNFLLRQLH
jgi:hypothetical protein